MSDLAAFFHEFDIQNGDAIYNLATVAKYESIKDLREYPPLASDLDKMGFTILERNKILRILAPPIINLEEEVRVMRELNSQLSQLVALLDRK